MRDENVDEDGEELPKSKSQIKREMQRLRDLGLQLVELSPISLKKFDFSEQLSDAILRAQGLKREAFRRELQHIGKLLREENDEQIWQQLGRISQPVRDEVRAFHELERWRDKLLTGNDELINQAVARFPSANRQHLRQLIRNAHKELQQEKSPKSARLLFQYLKEIQKE